MRPHQYTFFTTMILALLVSACGGGGGGDSGNGGSGGTNNVNYTGLTTQATVTNTNANLLTQGVINSSSNGVNVSDPFTGIASNTTTQPAITTLAHSLNRILPQLQARTRQTLGGVAVTENGSVAGLVSGSFDYSFTFDDQTGAFSGTFNFNNLNDGDGTLNGSIQASGTLDLNSFTITTASLNFPGISITDTTGSITLGGSVQVTLTGNTSSTLLMTMNIINGNVQFRIENLQVMVSSSGINNSVNISGRFYHSAYGYITVSASNLIIAANAYYPSSGTLMFTGAGNTSALVTFTSATTYTLQINADGVGGYETTAGCTWGGTCIIAAVN